MTLIIGDNRTTLDQGDQVTNFNIGTRNIVDYAEGDASISLAVNTATGQIFWTGTGLNLATAGNELVYVWTSNTATQNPWQSGVDSSHALWLSDGTNELALMNSGSDREVFQHSITQVQFQCMLIDVDYLATKFANSEIWVASGSYTSFDDTSVSEIGAYYVTLSKALAGGYNCFVDIIRYGTGGLDIYGGESTDPGTLLELATGDRSKADGAAHGIFREYTANTYGCQGSLNFGTTAATDDAYFEDIGASITYEDRDVGDDKFKLVVQGNSTDTNSFILADTLISSARPGVETDMSSANIDVLDLDGVVFRSLVNPVSFPTDTSTSLIHSVINSTFDGCGQIDPGTVTFQNITISNSTAGATGALLLDSDDSDTWLNVTLNSGGSGHGIHITSTGTYNFYGIVALGYGANGTADATIHNESGGLVTIDANNSSGLTYFNSTGSSTVVNNSVDLDIAVVDSDGDPIAGARVYLVTDDTAATELFNDLTDTAGTVSDTYNFISEQDVTGWVRKATSSPYYETAPISGTITANGLPLTIQMGDDE